jgi:hypothetical protein
MRVLIVLGNRSEEDKILKSFAPAKLTSFTALQDAMALFHSHARRSVSASTLPPEFKGAALTQYEREKAGAMDWWAEILRHGAGVDEQAFLHHFFEAFATAARSASAWDVPGLLQVVVEDNLLTTLRANATLYRSQGEEG